MLLLSATTVQGLVTEHVQHLRCCSVLRCRARVMSIQDRLLGGIHQGCVRRRVLQSVCVLQSGRMLQSGRKGGLDLVWSTLRMWMWMVGGVCGAGALRCASEWCRFASVRYGSNGVERT